VIVMPAWAWALIVVGIVAIAALVAWAWWKAQRTRELRRRFGPEYDRLREERGRRDAEQELLERRRHRESLEIRPLSPAARRDYAMRWETTQASFVDSPALAVTEADVLVQSVMRDRGYPVADTEQGVADLSVDHPDVMDRFRSANRIALQARERRATTEDLRQAMVHYRALFGRLLADEEPRSGLERSA
jgi:hypothetical protein